MTDFTDSNVSFWKAHGRFMPFVESGILDFAVFNPLVDDSLNLVVSGERIDCENVKNPMIAISNYFFDSTPVDVFYMKDKTVHESLVTLERNIEGVDPESYPHITQITTHFEHRELPDVNYYADPELNAVLEGYRRHINDGEILMPVGAFDVIRNLRKMSNNRLVLLSSDKAYTNPGVMISFERHEFAIHDGTFSYMVNYDAMGQYFHNLGGKCFATGSSNLSVQTVCLISMNEARDYEHIRYVFREKIDRQNPGNSLCAMLPGREKAEHPNDRLNYMLAQIRMQMADPFIFTQLAQHLTVTAEHAWRAQHAELLRLLDKALDNYYYYPGEVNLPFLLAPIYFMLEYYDKSLFCLDISAQLYGVNALHHFLVGQALDRLDRLQEAQGQYEKALHLQPDFPEAERALIALQARVEVVPQA